MLDIDSIMQRSSTLAMPGEPLPDAEKESRVEMSELLKGFKERAGNENARFADAVDSEYWVCMCFQNRMQKEEFLKKLQLFDLGDKYLDGMLVAQQLGVSLDTPVIQHHTSKPDRKLSGLTKE